MSDTSIKLSNDKVSRVFSIVDGKFQTSEIWNLASNRNYLHVEAGTIQRPNQEFCFRIDFNLLNANDFVYIKHERQSSTDVQRLTVELIEIGESPRVSVKLIYEVYNGHPVIRKWMEIKSLSSVPLKIHDLHWEVLTMDAVLAGNCTIYGNYARNVQSYAFEGDATDSAVVVHDPLTGVGFIIGNEAPSVLKCSTVLFPPNFYDIQIGMNHGSIPFERILHEGETFESPKGFLLLYKDSVWQNALDQLLQPFVRKYIYVEERFRPNLLYCSWEPFLLDINESLLYEMTNQAAKIGVDLFLIDAGWHSNFGDFEPDPDKFPNGMEPICNHIQNLGMVPGMWFSIASAEPGSSIGNEHPEWLCRASDGEVKWLESWNHKVMCLTTPWKEWFTKRVADYVEKCNLGYVKLDLITAVNPYVGEAGCFADNHAHRSPKESVYQLFEATKEISLNLKKQFPNLLVDITFEAWGKVNIADFSLASFSDVPWTTNINDAYQDYRADLRLRQEIYDRARIVPPDHLLMGCMYADQPHSKRSYLSGLGAIPVFLGDLRNVNDDDAEWFKRMVGWTKERRKTKDFYPYYKVGNIFERPRVDSWDGFARLDSRGEGIVVVFRNESPLESKSFPLPWVLPEKKYTVREQPNGRLIGEFEGHVLREVGLQLQIDRNNGMLLSVDIE